MIFFLCTPSFKLCVFSFQVVCDFSTSPPANIINHNKEQTIHVTGHEATSSYVIDVEYDVELSVLNSFIDSADSCSQHLQTNCKNSGQQYWSWKGRSGVAINKFFPGGDPSIGGCACKKSNSCASSSELILILHLIKLGSYKPMYTVMLSIMWYQIGHSMYEYDYYATYRRR